VLEYLKGRSGRKEYWASVGILFVVALGLAALNLNGASGVMVFLWLLIWGRRLHDINRSSAWGLLPIVAALVIAFVAVTFGGRDLLNAVQYSQSGKGAVSEKGAYAFFGLLAAVLVVQGGFTIWLGVKRGDAGDNKFGPPPNDTLTR